MYDTAVDTLDELVEKIIAAFDNVKRGVEEQRTATRCVQRRDRFNLEVNGFDFEHYL